MVKNITCMAGVALALVGVASGATPRPVAKIADLTPLTLTGTGFKPMERVLVYVELRGETRIRKTRATMTGGLTAAFTGLSLGRCGNDVKLRFVGSQGSRVVIELHQPDCNDR